MTRAGRSILFYLLINAFLSCGRSLDAAGEKTFAKAWSKMDTAVFTFENRDTTRSKDLFLVVRNNDAYPFRNLYLLVSLRSPKALVSTDTLQYLMADKWGRWLGTGIGAEKESVLTYRLDRIFDQLGTYELKIIQGMRRDSLQGITSVGYLLEDSKR